MNTQDIDECVECILPVSQSGENETSLLCVTCPFCKQTVNAVMKPTTIECPKCKVSVQRSNSKV